MDTDQNAKEDLNFTEKIDQIINGKTVLVENDCDYSSNENSNNNCEEE